MKKAFLLSLLVLMFSFLVLPMATASAIQVDHQTIAATAGDLATGSVQAYIAEQAVGIEAPAIQVSNTTLEVPIRSGPVNQVTSDDNYFEINLQVYEKLRHYDKTLDNGLAFGQEVRSLSGSTLSGYLTNIIT